jgi:holo-[acyl-carrier protein] synthase
MLVGIDIVQISEFKNRLEQSGGLDKVFTSTELEQNKSQDSLAGIFAAKEAFFKALGTRPDWLDVWIEKDKEGKPLIKCELLKPEQKVNLSISHSGDYSVAVVVI